MYIIRSQFWFLSLFYVRIIRHLDLAMDLLCRDFLLSFKCFLLDTVNDRLTKVWLMVSRTLTRIHINIWPAAVWKTPAGQIWIVQTSQETLHRATPSRTTWPQDSVIHTIPSPPPTKDEFILMVSSPKERLHQSWLKPARFEWKGLRVTHHTKRGWDSITQRDSNMKSRTVIYKL